MTGEELVENFPYSRAKEYLDSLDLDFVRRHLKGNYRLLSVFRKSKLDFEAVLVFDVLIEVCEKTEHDGESTVTSRHIGDFHERLWEAINEENHPKLQEIQELVYNLNEDDFRTYPYVTFKLPDDSVLTTPKADFFITHSNTGLAVLTIKPLFVYNCDCEKAVSCILAKLIAESGEVDQDFQFQENFVNYLDLEDRRKYAIWRSNERQ